MKRQILVGSMILLFAAGFAAARTIHVPGAYPYIDLQEAINQSNSGDIIVIAPGTYVGTGYYVDRGITITGSDPNNPYVVDATVLNFDGQDIYAFNLTGAETITLRGITIANSARGWAPNADGTEPGEDGADGGDWYGDCGISIFGDHIVSNCIIRNCRYDRGPAGGNGAPGDNGDYPRVPGAMPVNFGGKGGKGGSSYGAGIYISYGSPQILNTIIEDCMTVGCHGGYGGEGLDAAPPDANIPGGPGGDGGIGGDAMGGGVYIGPGGDSPIFENCIIRNCQVRAGDAADGNDGGDGITDEVDWAFPGGSGGSGGVPGFARGAGLYCAGGVNPTFIDCQFIGNRAYAGNGGDGGDAGEVHLAMAYNLNGGVGGLVERSHSWGGTPQDGRPPTYFSALGAGVYIESNNTITFTRCTFQDNVARGAVSGLGGVGQVRHEYPMKNFPIPSYGAGIYCNDHTTTTFTDCNMQGNWTTQEPDQYPGDLYPYGSGEVNPRFDYAEADYIGYGGGMCFIGGTFGQGNYGYVELNHCSISDNNAPVGGGVCASALTDFYVDGSDFVNNFSYLGAGLFSIDNFSNISKSTFIGNRAYDPNVYGFGAGLFNFSSDANISDCVFSDNATNGYGAGVYIAGEIASPLTAEPVLKNCLVNNNKAGLDGGGIYCDWYTEPNIINCTITGNEARGDLPFGVGYGGGLYCSYGSDVNIINSIVWDNDGPNTIGPELAIETWAGFEPTTLKVSYCDIEGGEAEAWVDAYSTLNWGAGNMDDDPLFVGGYYLSQVLAGQAADSNCVDAGNGTSADLGLQNYTTRTDNVPDACGVDLGYHYPIGIAPESCDLDFDGDVDLADLQRFVLHWLEQDCDLTGWCEGTDLNMDTSVNFVDYAICAEAYETPGEGGPLIPDTDPPEPDPSEWAIEPHPISSSAIHMVAETAYDPSGGVQYQFECVSGGGHNSDWQDSPEYTDMGLTALTEYTYRVRTHDVYDNTTGYSESRSATTLP